MVRLFEDTNIQAIADAIRAKNGSTDTYKTSEMAAAIAAIGGGNDDALLDRSITEVESNVATIGKSALSNCVSLTTANFPLATNIGASAFEGCTALQKATIPSARSIGASAFNGCNALKIADIGSPLAFPSSVFKYCYALKAVVLRGTSVCVLSSTSVFTQCYRLLWQTNSTHNPNGEKGYIYVPSAVASTYVSDSVWSSFYFRELERYTVDGTITGALDESKI